MAITLPIVVYGGGGIFTEYFNAIAATLGDNAFSIIIKIAILLAGVTAIVSMITKRDFLQCVKWFSAFYIVFYVLFLPQISLQIIDRTDEGHSYHVDNVPLGLGILASFTTTIGDSLTRLTDKIFSLPDDLRYSKTGMMMASKLVMAASKFQITDPELSENMQNFVSQCVFYDLLLNKYSIKDLFETKDVWSFVSSNTSPARAFLYNHQVTVCTAGASKINTDLQKSIDEIATRYGSRIFPGAANASMAKTELLKYLPISYGYLTNLSDTAAKLIQQNVIVNAIQNSALRFGATVNAPAALESYAYTRAEEQQRFTQQTLGELASYWLPIMKNAFECIMYGSFIFIVLLAVFPFGLTVLKNYAYTLVWIQAWAPLYAVIHMICSFYAKSHSVAVASTGITLQNLSGLIQVNQDMASLAGYLTLSVPFLAGGLVRGMAGTMTHLAQYIGGVTQSAGTSASAETVSGNFSLGNTSFNTHHALNTSANHFDTGGRVSSGMSYQLPGGESMTVMPDGTAVMDRRGAISSLGVELHLADSIRSSAMQQAEQSYNAGLSNSEAYSKASSAALRGISELSNHVGSSKSSGNTWAYSTNSNVTNAMHNVKELTHKFAEDHRISFGEAANVLSSVYGQIQGNISGSFGAKGDLGASGEANMSLGISGSREAQHSQSIGKEHLYSEAYDFVKNTSYAQNIETAIRATHDQTLHSSSDNGSRLINNIGSSWDEAQTRRQEAVSSFHQAESYRNIASMSRENAINVDVNAGQEFYEYLSSQPGTNGHGHMGSSGAAAILRDPVLAKHYADQFASQYTHNMVTNWNGGMAHSVQEVNDKYHANNQSIPTGEATMNYNQNNQLRIAEASRYSNLGEKNFISDSLQKKVEDKIINEKAVIHNSSSLLINSGQIQVNKVNNEKAKERYGSLIKDVIHGVDNKKIGG